MRETKPSAELLARAAEAAGACGDAVPRATREHSARTIAHRLHAATLIKTPAAA